MSHPILTEAAIGLGANIGDRLAHLVEARTRLLAIPGATHVASASVYETEPVGVPPEFAGQNFLNTVIVFNVALDVEAWSTAVHAIEDAMLRVRGTVRNTPRTIDLDLLYFGDTVMERPHLHLPHPQCTSRRFVCEPLAELRPGLVLPGETRTIAQILADMPPTPVVAQFKPAPWW